MIINNNPKRLAIYFFYDKQGIVDSYVPYFLTDLRKNVDNILIVCNGKLNIEGKQKLKQYGEVLVRDNKGFDVWAYKEGMLHLGWQNIEEYDELILLNSTIMGPLYPLSFTFEKMSSCDLDFWGLTKYFQYDGDPFGCISYGYIPDHIQSHFIVCRKSLIISKDFKAYWENMPMIENYGEAIGKHEAIFTKHFADLGYKWDVSVNVDNLRDYSGYPLMMCPVKLITEYQCPIFKRRSFFHDLNDYLSNSTGEVAVLLYNYIANQTNYNEDFIWETLLRNYNQYDISQALKLTYILPIKEQLPIKSKTKVNKVALVMHLYFIDLIEESLQYARSMPIEADIYITTDTLEKKVAIETTFNALENKVEVRLIENRGRDVSSLLVGVKDIIMNYDVACFVHDKKTAQVNPGSVGASFGYKCFDNTLGSKAYVYNVIKTFGDNPRLGLLTPPEPNHSAFFPTIGFEWGPNFNVTKKLAKKLELTVPIDVDKPPIAPFGTMFWFRPKAMQPLYKMNWQYTDFPPEPNEIDGTLLHAIERIYPYVVQQEGYYPAIAMTDSFAAIEYKNLRHYVRGYNQVAVNHGFGPYYEEMKGELNYKVLQTKSITSLIKLLIKRIAYKILPNKVYVSLRNTKNRVRS